MATTPRRGRSAIPHPMDAAEVRRILFWITAYTLFVIAVISFVRARQNRISVARSPAVIETIPQPQTTRAPGTGTSRVPSGTGTTTTIPPATGTTPVPTP